jgi:hypothetical protein
MTQNLKSAVIFGVGLALGIAIGNQALDWAKSKLA